MKKRIFTGMIALAAAAALAGCGGQKTAATEAATTEAATTEAQTTEAQTTQASNSAEEKELVVFAAASMTETLTKIAEDYKTVHPEVTISYNFDSSGTLKTQIVEGAPCDLFISAAQKQMNQLDATKDKEANPDGLDYILSDTRIDLLENKVTLAVADDNSKNVESFEDLAEKLKNKEVMLAMGNSDVPVGQYTQKILKYFDLNEEELANAGNITYGTNVKEVTTQVKEGSVDCGVIYGTDAFSAGLTVVDSATGEMCGRVIYPAAVMKNSENKEAAEEFLAYLQTKDAMDVFEAVGFSSAK